MSDEALWTRKFRNSITRLVICHGEICILECLNYNSRKDFIGLQKNKGNVYIT